jgi:hypothetical protein
MSPALLLAASASVSVSVSQGWPGAAGCSQNCWLLPSTLSADVCCSAGLPLSLSVPVSPCLPLCLPLCVCTCLYLCLLRCQNCVHSDLQRLELPHKMDELRGDCLMRGAWRSMVYRVTHPDAVGAPLQRSRAPSHYRQQQSFMRQQRLQQMYPATSEPLMIAGVGWQCPCGRIHTTRKCTDAVVQLRAISD